MKIAQKYSHLNGEEYLIVHHNALYKELIDIIEGIDAAILMTKESKEKTMMGEMLFSPIALNRVFIERFREKNWFASIYRYYLTTDRKLMQEIVPLSYAEQKKHLIANGIPEPLKSLKQTDFVKDGIAVEVQFGKYAFVAFDLFVKHLLFYSGGIINVGVEVLPTKKMQAQMSSGVAYFEGEVYNVLRHGRGNPPVPLLVLGIEP
jgi:hypothetical protein